MRTKTKTTKQQDAPPIIPALLTLKLIQTHYLRLGTTTLFRMISAGQFPKADIAYGRKTRLWLRETVENWIAKAIEQN